jgi:hypothetical protein
LIAGMAAVARGTKRCSYVITTAENENMAVIIIPILCMAFSRPSDHTTGMGSNLWTTASKPNF